VKKSPTRFLRRVDNKFTSASLYLDFQNMTTMDSRVTFTRASNATYFDGSGILRTAGNNVPRFDVNPTTLAPLGLLIEEQRTNLLIYSEDFSNVAWSYASATATANSTIAPDGQLTADTITSSGTAVFSQTITKAASSITYTGSYYIKGSISSFSLTIDDGTSNNRGRCVFDLSTNTVTTQVSDGTGFSGTSGTLTAVGNGWVRLTITTTTNTTTNARLRSFWAGSGTSIFIWGAQLEAGAFPTSYIPTVAATATRNADVASMTGTNFSSWYRADEGTFFVDWTAGQDDVFINVWSVGSTVVNGGFMNMRRGNTGNLAASIIDGTVTQSGISVITGSPIAGTTYKAVSAYKVNDFAAVANGGAVGTDTSGTVPSTIGTLLIGNGWSNGGATAANEYLNSTIRKIAFYPTRLSNAQLVALTR